MKVQILRIICIFRGENAYLWRNFNVICSVHTFFHNFSKLIPQSLKFRGWDRFDGIRRIHSIEDFDGETFGKRKFQKIGCFFAFYRKLEKLSVYNYTRLLTPRLKRYIFCFESATLLFNGVASGQPCEESIKNSSLNLTPK
jgi:hypothetical protein